MERKIIGDEFFHILKPIWIKFEDRESPGERRLLDSLLEHEDNENEDVAGEDLDHGNN